MTPNQKSAILKIIDNQDDLQTLWDKPRRYRYPGSKSKAILAVLCVVMDDGKPKWSACIRLTKLNRHHLKEVRAWTPLDRSVAELALRTELNGVGKLDTEVRFETKWGFHLLRDLTGDEMGVALWPKQLED